MFRCCKPEFFCHDFYDIDEDHDDDDDDDDDENDIDHDDYVDDDDADDYDDDDDDDDDDDESHDVEGVDATVQLCRARLQPWTATPTNARSTLPDVRTEPVESGQKCPWP